MAVTKYQRFFVFFFFTSFVNFSTSVGNIILMLMQIKIKTSTTAIIVAAYLVYDRAFFLVRHSSTVY